ncbi:MAG: hypothetical protein M1608_17650 [Candidatus Omnitrophica bacterium]|nr:hypothetical protein [Candidatus Omnitrophota bacterium]
MAYLNQSGLQAVLVEAFQAKRPYPWAHMRDTMTEEGWNSLRESLPDISQFRMIVGIKRGCGQSHHNRGIHQYRQGMACAEPWKEFNTELQGHGYDSFMRWMLGLKPGRLPLPDELVWCPEDSWSQMEFWFSRHGY